MLNVAYLRESNQQGRRHLMIQESPVGNQKRLFSTPERPAVMEEKLIHYHLCIY